MQQPQQPQGKAKKTSKKGAQPASKKPARSRYKASNRAQDRSVRNLMRTNGLTREEALQAILTGKTPKPSIKRPRRERKIRMQEGDTPIGERDELLLLGVPLDAETEGRLAEIVEQNEAVPHECDNEDCDICFEDADDEIEFVAAAAQLEAEAVSPEDVLPDAGHEPVTV